MRIVKGIPLFSFGQYLKVEFNHSEGVVIQETLNNPFDRAHFRMVDNRKDPIHGELFAKIYGNIVFLLKTKYFENIVNLGKVYEILFPNEPEIQIIDLG